MKIKTLALSGLSAVSLLAGGAVFADSSHSISAKFTTDGTSRCGIRTGCTSTITPVTNTMSATCSTGNKGGIPSTCAQYSPLKNMSPNPLIMKSGYSYTYTPSFTIQGDAAYVTYPAGSVWGNSKITVVGSSPLVTMTVPCVLSANYNLGQSVNVVSYFSTTSTAVSSAKCTVTPN